MSKSSKIKGIKVPKKRNTRLELWQLCIAADNHRVPITLIGKPKNPVCFELLQEENTPIPYKDQYNAWFDKEITVWRINNVFWTNHTT